MPNSLQILNSLASTGSSAFSAAKIVSSIKGSDYLDRAIGSWNTVLPPFADTGRFAWSQVEFVNDKFFTTVVGRTSAAWSYDGANWNTISLPMSTLRDGIAYGGGIYTGLSNYQGLTGNIAPQSFYSTDGINWTVNSSYITAIAQLVWTTPVYGIVSGTGIFVSLGASNNSNWQAYSYDGITWTFGTGYGGGGANSVAYGKINGQGIFVAVPPHQTTSFMYSTDGITWKQSNTFTALGFNVGWISVTYGYNDVGIPMFVAVSSSASGQPAGTIYSYDGINWTYGSISDYYWSNIIYTPNKLFIATSTSSNVYNFYAYSYDGINFNTAPFIGVNNYQLYKLAYGNGVVTGVPGFSNANQFAYATLPTINTTSVLTY